jgi:putative PEP-CTERM system histidine kinase
VLAALLTVRGSGRGIGRLLVAAVLVQVAWSAAMAVPPTRLDLPYIVVLLLDALRPLAWSSLLLAMLWAHRPGRPLVQGLALAVAIAGLHFCAPIFDDGPFARFGGGLLAAVFGLVCVEQLYRNTRDGQRWAVKFLCLALGSLFAFDLVLLGDALLFGVLDPRWWAARGYANALMAPLVAITAARTPDWRLDVQLSRHVVFHTSALLASGAFLLTVAAIGQGMRWFGGEWGAVAQTLVFFAACVSLAALIASGSMRARLRVAVAKHFFSHRYDYRAEWLRLTELLARAEPADAPQGTLSQRALQGLADVVDSPGGGLWLATEDGDWRCEARLGSGERESIGADDPLPRFLAQRRWIVDVREQRAHPERYGGLSLPHWLGDDSDAWVVVPLVLQDQLIGIAQLQRPVSPPPLDWELRDILNTAGRQVAGYLAVRQAVEKVVQARQFDSFNRMSAFVVHDLKNLVAQLALLLKNAARHRDNPDFQRDMLETVENVLDRMQGLLLQLRAGTRPIASAGPLPLGATLRAAVAARKGLPVETQLDIAQDAECLDVVAHADRLERVVGHLLQNAAEATPSDCPVRIIARRDGVHALVEVVDSGHGMSRSFVETQLFKPFNSTKEHGMGIGTFESREYLREIGGTLQVTSTEGKGSTFTLRLPIHATTPSHGN